MAFCRKLRSQATRLSDIVYDGDPVVLEFIGQGIDAANAEVTSDSAKIMKWTILRTDFSVAGGELGERGWAGKGPAVGAHSQAPGSCSSNAAVAQATIPGACVFQRLLRGTQLGGEGAVLSGGPRAVSGHFGTGLLYLPSLGPSIPAFYCSDPRSPPASPGLTGPMNISSCGEGGSCRGLGEGPALHVIL